MIGLGASIASLVDYLGPAPTFCAEGGCATVRASAWSHPLGIPMPVLGIAFFATALVLAFVAAPRARKLLAVSGAAWAVLLIGLQAFSIGAWCKLCLVADPAAILHAACVLAGAELVHVRRRAIAVVPALGAVVGALALWTRTPPAPALPPGTPAFVQRAQASDALTIVEVVDFECPFCREMQRRLASAIARAHVPVRIVRKMMPLPRHPHALQAALAWCCAEAQGKGDAMAEALFAAPPEALTLGRLRAARRQGRLRSRALSPRPATMHARVAGDMHRGTQRGRQGPADAVRRRRAHRRRDQDRRRAHGDARALVLVVRGVQQVRADQLVEIAVEHAIDVGGLHLGAVIVDLLVREQHVAADLRAPLDLEPRLRVRVRLRLALRELVVVELARAAA